jgi:hypothetical protein
LKKGVIVTHEGYDKLELEIELLSRRARAAATSGVYRRPRPTGA